MKAIINGWPALDACALPFTPAAPTMDGNINAGDFAWKWVSSTRLHDDGWHESDNDRGERDFACSMNLEPFLSWLTNTDPKSVEYYAKEEFRDCYSDGDARANIKIVLCRLHHRGLT